MMWLANKKKKKVIKLVSLRMQPLFIGWNKTSSDHQNEKHIEERKEDEKLDIARKD